MHVCKPAPTAYSLLCKEEPRIATLDDLPTEEMQALWIRHFCPQLGKNPTNALALLNWVANYLDDLSPGPHASMGFVSKRLSADDEFAEVKQ